MPSEDISVVLPAHGAAPFLAEAVASVLYADSGILELLVVDDRLDPAAAEALGDVDDSRLRVVQCAGVGLVAALNTGLREARGSLVARMDADDVSLPDRFVLQGNYLRHNEHVLAVGGQLVVIDEYGAEVGVRRYPVQPEAIVRQLAHRNVLAHPAVMFDRAAVLAVGGYREEFVAAEDYELWLRLSERGSLANVDVPVLKYRVHSGQVTSSSGVTVAESTYLAQWSARQRRSGRNDLPLPWEPGRAVSLPWSVARLVRRRVVAAARAYAALRQALAAGSSVRAICLACAWVLLRPRYSLSLLSNLRDWLRVSQRTGSSH